MENKKDIGKVFKHKLEQLDKEPSTLLWSTIEKDLDTKKKKKSIFFLFPALLILSLGFITFYSFHSNVKNNNITPENNNKKQISSKTKTIPVNQNNENQINNTYSSDTVNDFQNFKEINNKKLVRLEDTPSSNQLSTDIDQDKKGLQDQEDGRLKQKKTNTKKELNSKAKVQNSSASKTYYIKEPVKIITNSKRLVKSTPEYDEYEIVKKYTYVIKKKKVVVNQKNKALKSTLTNQIQKRKNNSKKAIGKKNLTSKTRQKNHKAYHSTKQDIIEKEKIDEIHYTLSDKDKIVNQSLNTEIKKDTIAIDSLQNKTILKEKKKKKTREPQEIIEKKINPKYMASVFYGPSIFGLLSKNSQPNKTFNGLEKKHPISSYYGFSFKTLYGKIGYRVGISKINLSLSNVLNKDQFIPNYNHITLNSNLSAISLMEDYQYDSNINLTHELSYYELPMELLYSIIQEKHKINVDLFTGISIMIRDKNTLYLSSDQKKKSSIGYIDNTVDSNLSVNIGIDLNYNIYKKFYIDCNPIVKFYGKTFKEEDSIKTYSFSLQTGVSYKF